MENKFTVTSFTFLSLLSHHHRTTIDLSLNGTIFHIYRTEILWAFLFTCIGPWQFSPSWDKIKLLKDIAWKQTMKITIATFPPAFCTFCSELDNNARHPATADPASCYDAGVTIWRWMCWTLPLTFWRRCSNLSHSTIATLCHTLIKIQSVCL